MAYFLALDMFLGLESMFLGATKNFAFKRPLSISLRSGSTWSQNLAQQGAEVALPEAERFPLSRLSLGLEKRNLPFWKWHENRQSFLYWRQSPRRPFEAARGGRSFKPRSGSSSLTL